MDYLKPDDLRSSYLNYLKNNYSLIALLIVLISILWTIILTPPLNVFSNDVLGYYLYLPAKFKYHDLALHNFNELQNILETYHSSKGFYQAFQVENGNYVIKYTMGMSIMYAPFYLLGDVICPLFGYANDGFSLPYQLSVLYGCYLYTLLGLVIFRKVLLHFFNDKIAAVILLLLVFGTNYLLHVSIHTQPAMSHNVLFSLHALTIFLTIKWHASYKLKYIIALGISIGLTAIIRPTEVLIAFVPLFYNVYNIKTLKQKLGIIIQHKKQILLCVFLMLIIVSFQFIYWKLITGKFIFNSYGGHPNEGFNFLHPYILEFLFSFRKGWLLYTPLMLFSIFGFYFFYKKNKPWFFACLIYFMLSFYIICSWSCWWYGTSYSCRAIIPAYVVLSIPLGYFLNYVLNHKVRFFLIPLFLLLLSINLFQSWQVSEQILNGSRTTRAYYTSVFLQTTHPTDKQKGLLLIDKYSTPGILKFNEKYLSNFKPVCNLVNDYESHTKSKPFVVSSIHYSKSRSCITNPVNPYAIDITKSYKELTNKSYLLCKVSAQLFTCANPDSLDAGLILSMFHKDKCYNFKYMNIKDLNLKRYKWNYVYFYYLTTDFWDRRDNLRASFWNKTNANVYIDDLKFEAFEPFIDETVF